MGSWTRRWKGYRRKAGLARDLGILVVFLACCTALCLKVESHLCYLFAVSFTAAFVLVPPTARRVRQLGAVVLPGGRSIHGRRTPLLGGIAVFVPFFVAATVMGFLGDPRRFGLAAGTLVMLLVGGYDDLKGVRPRTKVLAQVLAALLLYLSGFRLPALDVPGLGTFPLGSLEIPMMVFWVVLASNAFNLTDGMDGLASSLALVGCVGALAVGARPILAVILAGAVLAFLRYNLPRASIFLGDAGSLMIGFALAAFALAAPTTNNVGVAYGLLAYSLGDVAIAVSRRALRGKPLFAGDKSHIHHKLRMHLGSTWGALLAATAFAASHLVVVLLLPGLPGLGLCAGLWALLVLTLMAVGRVRVRHMLSSRLPFQRMHLVRNYVLGLLRFAEEPPEVENALRHLVDDMGLVSLDLRHFRFKNPRPPAGLVEEVPVALEEGVAHWRHAPQHEERAVDDERKAVVCELIRAADERLTEIANGHGEDERKAASGARRAGTASQPFGHGTEPV